MIRKKDYLKLKIFAVITMITICCWSQKLEKPNIVIIYGDDVGYGDVGVYGSKMIPTPNIDQLAKEGLRFIDGHCSASTCTPSRYSMLTGLYAFRKKINVLPPEASLIVPTDILTLPKLFKQAGYTTGIIGKWHLGLGEKGKPVNWNAEVKPGPKEVGFDRSFILPATNDRVPSVYLDEYNVLNLDPKDPMYVSRKLKDVQNKGNTVYPNGRVTPEAMTYYKNTGKQHNETVINGIGRMGYMSGGKSALFNDETMTDTFVEKAKEYIVANKEKPFFLYYAAQDIHVPRAPHKRFQGKTKLGYRGDAMVQFDWATGEILKTLEEQGLTENTIVIFSSDNGPTYDDGYEDGTTISQSYGENDRGHDASGIYKGGKYQIYEGGTRVPFIVKWPSHIKPGISKALISQMDLLPSFAKLLKIKIPKEAGIDSENNLKALLGENKKGLPFMIEESKSCTALRIGDWKYIMKAPKKGRTPAMVAQLYDLSNDPGEGSNVIEKYEKKAEGMRVKLVEIMNDKK
jgi:arylsulfatase A-like enzyme